MAHKCFSMFVKQADPVVVLNENNAVVATSNRLQEGGVPPLEQGMVVGQLILADSLIIGNCNNQVLIQFFQFSPPNTSYTYEHGC